MKRNKTKRWVPKNFRQKAKVFSGSLSILMLTGADLYADGSRYIDGVRVVEAEGITVTANKIDEDLADVPQSVTVLDRRSLEEKKIERISDVIPEIPNMLINPNHGASLNVRGLNTSMFTNNNPVVVYIDGIPYSERYGFNVDFGEVDRVEVLRGPQGTLYGKDAIGGVINIVTKDPGDEWKGKLGIEYGSHNFFRSTIQVAGPVRQGSPVFAGVNAQYQRDDGWIENVHPGMSKEADDKNLYRFSSFLLYKPNDRLSVRFTFSREYDRSNWMSGYGIPSSVPFSAIDRDDAETVDFDVSTVQKVQTASQSLNVAYRFDDLTLTSTTTHSQKKIRGEYDADFGNNPLYAGLYQFERTDVDVWTQEVRASSNNKEGFRWIAGIYADTDKRNQGPYGMQFPNFDPESGAFLGNFSMNAESVTDSRTQAVFGQIMVPLGDRLELTLGRPACRGRKGRCREDSTFLRRQADWTRTVSNRRSRRTTGSA